MSVPESLRDEVAAVLDGQAVRVQVVSVGSAVGFLRAESALHLAKALFASPALARVIREAKAEAWDEAADYDMARAIVRHCEDRGDYVPNPYREQP